MEPILTAKGLSVRLEGRDIFQDLNFRLNDRETMVILGPNGAGKTVLLRTLLGLVPYRGQISWRSGVKIGYVPQKVAVSKDLPVSVGDFFALKGISLERARRALEDVGVFHDDFLYRPLGVISGGQLQRVLIARALVDNPDVLVFDEPTAGIDIEGEETIQTLLRREQEQRNLAIILVTHDLSAVYGQATNVLCISHKMYCFGPPQEILDPQSLKKLYGSEMKFFSHQHD